METALPTDDDRLYYSFGEIAACENLSHFIRHMAGLIVKNELTRSNINEYISRYSIRGVSGIKDDMLDMLILYLNIILNDGLIDDQVKRNFGILKLYFNIKEGDFYKYRWEEIRDIIQRQLDIMYGDNILTPEEVMKKLDLQEIFGLSYSEFQTLKDGAMERALARGADPNNLNPHVSVYTLKRR